MAASNVNVVVITGNLRRTNFDTPRRTAVCELRVAVNSRRETADGEWEDKPNFFDVTVMGRAGRRLRQLPLQGPAGWRSKVA